jgi:hypothetical protein
MKTVVKQKIVKLKTKWRGIITLSYNLWVSQPIVEKIWQEYLAEQS